MRAAKYEYLHVVQGNYGYGHGWEDVTAETDWYEARARLREYRENDPAHPYRQIQRRELAEEIVQREMRIAAEREQREVAS